MHTLEQLRAGELAGTVRLQLRCGLAEFPREIFDLADTLEILDLSGNSLTSLPDDLARLRRLRIIFCSDNPFTELPEVLGRCPSLTMVGFKACRIEKVPAPALPVHLRWLILTDNRIEQLPAEIGRCADMQKLMLSGNRLRALPPELANCSKLELLRIASNLLPELPQWLLAMPRLSWLACAGNPFNEAPAAHTQVRSIGWNELQIQHKLGEGASGIIHQATLDGTPVAVKVYKGTMTSDGSPAHEMAACIAAGQHPNLIPVLGTIPDHPENLPALVMPLMDPNLRNLAGPPSFATCTRDVYAEGQTFSAATLLSIAQGIASAAAHLHAQGIMHGDLYAHNILYCGKGNAVLGDFGGASMFKPGTALARALQGLEVRAFGCLLEELVAHCNEDLAQALRLASECLQPSPLGRPTFSHIAARLAEIAQTFSQERATP